MDNLDVIKNIVRTISAFAFLALVFLMVTSWMDMATTSEDHFAFALSTAYVIVLALVLFVTIDDAFRRRFSSIVRFFKKSQS